MSEEIKFEEIDDTINESESILAESIDNYEDTNYDEVLTLTEYDGGLGGNNNLVVVAEYDNIDIVNIEKRHKLEAKSFVQKVTKFITQFNDVELTTEHEKYLKEVGNFELESLVELMTFISINKQMINNIVRRVNSVQAEDYAMIATYNSLLNQHLKLMKELQNRYKQLPGLIKKMKAEVICNQELIGQENPDEVMTENFGETQFNNQKQLLKKLKEEWKIIIILFKYIVILKNY